MPSANGHYNAAKHKSNTSIPGLSEEEYFSQKFCGFWNSGFIIKCFKWEYFSSQATHTHCWKDFHLITSKNTRTLASNSHTLLLNFSYICITIKLNIPCSKKVLFQNTLSQAPLLCPVQSYPPPPHTHSFCQLNVL